MIAADTLMREKRHIASIGNAPQPRKRPLLSGDPPPLSQSEPWPGMVNIIPGHFFYEGEVHRAEIIGASGACAAARGVPARNGDISLLRLPSSPLQTLR